MDPRTSDSSGRGLENIKRKKSHPASMWTEEEEDTPTMAPDTKSNNSDDAMSTIMQEQGQNLSSHGEKVTVLWKLIKYYHKIPKFSDAFETMKAK